MFFSGVKERVTNAPVVKTYETLKDLVNKGIETKMVRELLVGWRDRSPARSGYSFFKLRETTEGMTLEDAWLESWDKNNNQDNSNYIEGRDAELKDIKAIIINLLVYIRSGRPDIREFKNHIRYNSVTKKPHHPFADLTERNIKLVGFSWKKLPQYTTDSWYSRPHFGWRRCGINREDLVYTYIKGSHKSRKAGKEELPLDNMNVVEE